MKTHSTDNNWLSRLSDIEKGERRAVLLSFAYFFCLLCGYYIIRPVRDEMGVVGGVDNLQWLFTGTFVVMLLVMPVFGWVTSRFPRRLFLPWVYWFFIFNLLLFFALFRFTPAVNDLLVARVFFIWASVFNLFVVSVFWSFMADLFRDSQAKRLFPFIAAGGTAGAIVGPAITTVLAPLLGTGNLLLLSALFLGFAVLCIKQLGAWQAAEKSAPEAANISMGGSIFDGLRLVVRSPYLLGICLLILFYTTLATFLYFQQAAIIRDSFADSAQRTAVFAFIDMAVNSLTLLFQLMVTARIIRWLGLAKTLSLIPLLLALGFAALGNWPVLAVLATVQILRRAGNYAIMRPAREILFVVLTQEEKYKAKNFIDTTIYRGGDAVSAWAYAGLGAIGLSLAQIAWLAVPLALVWAIIAYMLGIRQQQIAEAKV